MKIQGNSFLITGGTSLVGARIAKELIEGGAQRITLFDNFSLSSPQGMDELLDNPKIRLIKGDVLRLDQLVDAAQRCSGIFAIAGLLTVALARDPRQGMDVNISGTLNTFEAAKIVGAGKVVTASSLAVYGSMVGNHSDESTGFASLELAPPRALYALSKLAGEQIGWLYHRDHGIDFAAMRYGSVYGERQHDRGVNVFTIIEAYKDIKSGRAPRLKSNADSGHDLVYVGDAAMASVQAMASDNALGPYNISSGTTTSIREMIEIVCDLMQTPLRPEFELGKSAASATTHGGAGIQMSVSVEKARSDFGWSPSIDARAGIQKLLHWLESSTALA